MNLRKRTLSDTLFYLGLTMLVSSSYFLANDQGSPLILGVFVLGGAFVLFNIEWEEEK